jgi:hypothetical protein
LHFVPPICSMWNNTGDIETISIFTVTDVTLKRLDKLLHTCYSGIHKVEIPKQKGYQMKTYYQKAWDIVGYTYHASAYCVDCGEKLPEIDPEGNDKHPIFASDEFFQVDSNGDHMFYNCDTCLTVID